MTSSSNRLGSLQRDLLESFSRLETGFVLTGGAALAAFHLGHRETQDLDFFFSDPGVDLDDKGRALEQAARSVGGVLKLQQRYPDFRRYVVTRGEDSTVVDLVIDSTPRANPPQAFGETRVESMAEIAANKLCTLVGRAEIRDLVDLCALLDAGVDLTKALQDAHQKEGGVDAATLAWLLHEMRIGEDATIPGPFSASELDQRRGQLVRTLRQMAFPEKG